MRAEIDNQQDYLDIRDIIERFETLEDLESPDEDEQEELASLKALLGELEGKGGDHQWLGDWYPVTLIRDSYFVDAMQELVTDIGDLPKDIPGYLVIDWDQTAENLKADYASVEYGDITYWYR